MEYDHDAIPAANNGLWEEVERLRLLYTTTLEFNASLDFDEVLKRVFSRIVAVVGAQGGSIWIAEGDQLRCRLVVGKASRTLLDTTEPLASAFRDDPLRGGRSTIVSDATGEHSGEILTRMTTDFVALTAMSAAMVADDVTVCKIEMLNKSTGAGIFDERDRELLEGLATSAALALRNAQLHQVGKQAHDLAIVLEISREITATLNLDRVLQSVVNLAGKALPFDQAAIGIFVKGECVIRAIAGEDKVDPKAERTQRLAGWGQYTARNGEAFYLSDRESPSSDAEASFARMFGPELEAEELRSGFYLPLKDEQGVLGVLMLESRQPDFLLPRQRELAEILANQTTVALRNAELYAQVPMVDALGALAAKKRELMAVPRGRLLGYTVLALVGIASVTLIRWPLGAAGEAPTFRAMGFTQVRTLVGGVVERVMARE
ncbi:MAG: GAF domain-containing protein [Gemmatimonadales bacterium]